MPNEYLRKEVCKKSRQGLIVSQSVRRGSWNRKEKEDAKSGFRSSSHLSYGDENTVTIVKSRNGFSIHSL